MGNIDAELLDRYLAGECDPDEQALVEALLLKAGAGLQFAQQVRDAAGMLGRKVSPERKASMRAALREEFAAAPAGPDEVEPNPGVRGDVAAGPRYHLGVEPMLSPGIRMAGIALLVLGAAVAAFVVRRSAAPAPVVAAAPMKTVTVPRGQRADFRLPDGTRVVLGPGSTLRHAVAAHGGTRDIELQGEAYFEVVKDEQRVFRVRAGDVVAEDRGTMFGVRAFPEDASPRVVVKEGRVALRAATTPSTAARVLDAGQLGRLRADGEVIVERVDPSTDLAWIDGHLIFSGTRLADALPELCRFFDLDIRLSDATLGELPLTATFRNQLTNDGLDLLAAALDLRVERHGRTVTFRAAP